MEALALIKQQIQSFLDELNSPLIDEFCSKLQHGKMLRSKLALAIAGQHPQIIRLCAVIEMIQNASLLHDDVIDKSQMRRSKPSINALFGNKNAIMLGDVLYAKAFSELLFFAPSYPLIPKIIAQSVSLLSIGEIEDVHSSQSFQTNKEQYLSIIEHKTASLISATAYSAAILANKSNPKQFEIYGRNLGIAFQIIDDILDITAQESTLGKPALNDFKEGKSTLAYIDLYHCLSQQDQARLESYFKKELSNAEQDWIKEQFTKHQIIQKSHALAREFAQNGIEAICNQSCDKLIQIMSEMVEREF